ncbi:hypothetical protein AX760_13905 [Pararhizobium antarcticum]|uniref:Uncharacterized protein n=1 Tax=Pararhizobium antarcticum TaxID=1798805 RepID=A0A657LV25_9HYPH|nr:hypothetical protein AX761_15235 [Rhizobium sp. 58]OJF99070.1 hypothetical protein AX760_13905 [Pararhizobium antarcticum]
MFVNPAVYTAEAPKVAFTGRSRLRFDQACINFLGTIQLLEKIEKYIRDRLLFDGAIERLEFGCDLGVGLKHVVGICLPACG